MSGPDRARPRWKRGKGRKGSKFTTERCGSCGSPRLQKVEVEGKTVSICERCSGFVPVEVRIRDEERGDRRIYAGPGLRMLEVPASLEFTATFVGVK